jgi:regulator of PEP synthase PpsR (kinase-PPPase family)
MKKQGAAVQKTEQTPVFVVSGGMGSSGEQLVRTVLAQFQDIKVPVKIIARVHHPQQVEQVVEQAATTGGTIVHTMVNPELRQMLIELANTKRVVAIDMAGPLLEHLSNLLNQKPIGQPGLYRQLHETYLKRIEAIEFTRALDDGVNRQRWSEAEIVLVGVSRVGKTPLSLYLSMMGWKVVNVPLVIDIPPPAELFELDRRRVIGLTVDPGQLLTHRKHRQRQLGVAGRSAYTDPVQLYEEVEAARKLFRRSGYRVLDITDKPIETIADEIITIITRQVQD